MRVVYLFVCVVFVWWRAGVYSQLFVYEEQPVGSYVGRPIATGQQFRYVNNKGCSYLCLEAIGTTVICCCLSICLRYWLVMFVC